MSYLWSLVVHLKALCGLSQTQEGSMQSAFIQVWGTLLVSAVLGNGPVSLLTVGGSRATLPWPTPCIYPVFRPCPSKLALKTVIRINKAPCQVLWGLLPRRPRHEWISCRKDHMMAEPQEENITQGDTGDRQLTFRTRQTAWCSNSHLHGPLLLPYSGQKPMPPRVRSSIRLFLICLSRPHSQRPTYRDTWCSLRSCVTCGQDLCLLGCGARDAMHAQNLQVNKWRGPLPDLHYLCNLSSELMFLSI